MPKIAFIHNCPFPFGGAERVSSLVATMLHRRGFEVWIFCTEVDKSKLSSEELTSIRFETCGSFSGQHDFADKVLEFDSRHHFDVIAVLSSLLRGINRISLHTPARIVYFQHSTPFWELRYKFSSIQRRVAHNPYERLRLWLLESVLHRTERRIKAQYLRAYNSCDAFGVLCEGYRRRFEQTYGLGRPNRLRVIRNAHYPQDPAFMDACDELGLFVIVNTPGWQFWSDEPVFAQRVYEDIRNMVRRDRNHPSVWLWEPILNETNYPADFARRVTDILREEYPYPYCYAGCDVTARGHELFPVQFAHPINGEGGPFSVDKMDPSFSYFTREWGDNVDDWSSHNSPSRASRAWGEIPMLVQAQGYARPDYQHTCYDMLYRTTRQHVGGCLWHSFDHQRGYHPDPFYGGIMDAFRQPKLAYYMFCAQRPPQANPQLKADSGPMVYIAHSMTPFSPRDVTVYSNCEEVRLTYCKGGKTWLYQKKDTAGMPSPVITFQGVFDVMKDKALARAGKHADSYLLAEGMMEGKVVATHQVFPARRPSRLLLWVDDEGVPLKADGSDMVVVVAAVADEQGRIKRLNNGEVQFEIEGPATLVADSATFTNPAPVRWGTAPVLVRAGLQPGKIKIRASVPWKGKHTPEPVELVLISQPAGQPLVRGAVQ